MHGQFLVRKDRALPTSGSLKISTVRGQALPPFENPYIPHDVQLIGPGECIDNAISAILNVN
jgi:hypothetical protein